MNNPITGQYLAVLSLDPQALAERLATLPHVVGIQVGVAVDGGVSVGSAGRVDVDRADEVSPSTTFRPGSITKLLTATMVMQCVDEGLLDLDAPVSHYLSKFRPGHGTASWGSTVRVAHLISHSSGIDAGDLFVDTGDDDASIGRYVELVADAPLLFPPGSMFSYNNAGFVIAGHLVEVVRGMPWEDAAVQHVLAPLGLQSTSFVPGKAADAGDERTARGHVVDFGGVMGVPPGTLAADPMCSRGLGPAGATLVSTAGDLARFAATHAGSGGAALLSERSVERMQRLHQAAPGGVTQMAGVGFGWQIWHSPLGLRPRIGGANPGQSGVVLVDPATATAVAVLTNSNAGINAVTALLDGASVPKPDDDPAPPDLAPYTGTYRSHLMDVSVEQGEAGLTARLTRIEDARWGAMQLSGVVPGGALEQVLPLTPVDRTTFASPLGPFAFLGDGGDAPHYLRLRMRVHRRVDGTGFWRQRGAGSAPR